jgi:hypothetical protein
MSELEKINEKLFYLFAGGLIIEILAIESLRRSFLFSAILGAILLVSFSIYKLADYWEWVEAIRDWIEEFIEMIGDWFKEAFGR